ncbi:hypothetical protein [Pandoraea sp. ISTKB]|uniref:hypothetical protein n=1 Tax=Pandoraea sp. ISTKB TaxID=1586708 RepID=UPI000846B2F9|nr:hypothetical protein [Pandoraea sp. ISTKB]ODP33096.1 hypothetical protein A9762_20860 [Pandoraea sp. ISTKB]
MVRPAISTPFPLPRQRTKGANDKSPQTNPTSSLGGDVLASGESIQMDDAPLARREFQIDEGGALTRPAKPETTTMHKQPLNSFQRVLDELDAIGADTRTDLAPLTKAIRAFGNAQYDPLWMGMDVAKEPDMTGIAITLRSPADLEALQALMATPMTAQQADDAAVDIFATEMKRKLARSRAKGRGGWQAISADVLSHELREHVEKGDPMDVATYAMFLWHHDQPISADAPMTSDAIMSLAHDFKGHRMIAGTLVDDFDSVGFARELVRRGVVAQKSTEGAGQPISSAERKEASLPVDIVTFTSQDDKLCDEFGNRRWMPLDIGRAVFESCAQWTSLERETDGTYTNPFVQSSWEGWQACTALSADSGEDKRDAEIASLRAVSKEYNDLICHMNAGGDFFEFCATIPASQAKENA